MSARPDAGLLALGEALDRYSIAMLANATEREARKVSGIVKRVTRLQATSLQGLYVQVRALEVIYAGEPITFESSRLRQTCRSR